MRSGPGTDVLDCSVQLATKMQPYDGSMYNRCGEPVPGHATHYSLELISEPALLVWKPNLNITVLRRCSLGVALRANNSYTRALESFTLALSLNHTLVSPVL